MKSDEKESNRRAAIILGVLFVLMCLCSGIGLIIPKNIQENNKSSVQGISTASDQETKTTDTAITETIAKTPSAKQIIDPTDTPTETSSPTQSPTSTPLPTAIKTGTPIATQSPYSCNIKKNCSQVSSCKEAYYQLNVCGNTSLDRDHDTIPCESICL